MLSVAVSYCVPVLNVPPVSYASVTILNVQALALGKLNVVLVVMVAGAVAPSAEVVHEPDTHTPPLRYSTFQRTVRR